MNGFSASISLALQILDLSYNLLSQSSLCIIGSFPHVRVLDVTCNGLKNFPVVYDPPLFQSLEVCYEVDVIIIG